jgi:hypothetical protein
MEDKKSELLKPGTPIKAIKDAPGALKKPSPPKENKSLPFHTFHLDENRAVKLEEDGNLILPDVKLDLTAAQKKVLADWYKSLGTYIAQNQQIRQKLQLALLKLGEKALES